MVLPDGMQVGYVSLHVPVARCVISQKKKPGSILTERMTWYIGEFASWHDLAMSYIIGRSMWEERNL